MRAWHPNGSRATRVLIKLLCVCLLVSQSGCSLFTMAGKMLFGDPVLESPFRKTTGANLVKDERRVVVVCSAPAAVKSDYPTLTVDLQDELTRQLRSRDVLVVRSEKVARWMDDHGEYSNDPDAIARAFDVDYIIHVHLDQFSYREESSADLYRGRSAGNVFAYEVTAKKGEPKRTRHVFSHEYTDEYPKTNPISALQMSPKLFQERYLKQVAEKIAQIFCDHRATELVQ